jgi:hypothetical protein
MAISGPASYVPTAIEFMTHWSSADAALGVGNEIVLPGGAAIANLTTGKDELVAKRDAVQDKLNDKEIARGDIDNLKPALRDRLMLFNDKIRAFFAGSKWLNALPGSFALTDGQANVVGPLADANSLWKKINADPGTTTPVTLLGGYTQATFETDLTTLRAAYETIGAAEQDLKLSRSERNDLQDAIREILLSYRKVLPTFFAADDALVETLPRLSPTGGSGPNPVEASGTWDAVAEEAAITWSASSSSNIQQYEIRMSPGPVYDEDTESPVGSVAPDTLEFRTITGLESLGSTASFRVYVILTTGNEVGSNVVIVVRP